MSKRLKRRNLIENKSNYGADDILLELLKELYIKNGMWDKMVESDKENKYRNSQKEINKLRRYSQRRSK